MLIDQDLEKKSFDLYNPNQANASLRRMRLLSSPIHLATVYIGQGKRNFNQIDLNPEFYEDALGPHYSTYQSQTEAPH